MKKLFLAVIIALILFGCNGNSGHIDYPEGPYDVVPDSSDDWEGIVILWSNSK